MAAGGGPDPDGLRRIVVGNLEFEKQGDGVGVLVGAFQQMRRHNPAGSGTVDDIFLGGSLQLPKRRQKYGGKNRQTSRW